MSFPVRYYCPRCELIVELERDGYLEDKSVTPYPLEGWTYTDFEGDYDEADGVRIVCGDGLSDESGCGEPFYLNFIRFDDGQQIEPKPESDRVRLASNRPTGPTGPIGPNSPNGPNGPDEDW